MTSLVGQSLDRYRVAALLGEGGMGAVYKAHDAMLLRDVAVKVMHGQFGRQQRFRERFLQEARAAARLDHPGIVKVYDFGQQGELLYIVMEFIPGANLRKMLRDLAAAGKGVVLPEAIGLLRQVALALNYAHQQGIFHRDIKPDNIMLKPEAAEALPYRPVITDLGLAKLTEGGVATQTGTSMGTPAYMAPEQVLGQEADARSDVYSLGVLLYELAVGQLPFPVKTITDAVRYHLQETPPRPRSLKPDLPETLEAVILKALEKDPAARFADAGALAEALAAEGPRAATVAAPAAALGAAVSLITPYQQSLVELRGASVFEAFPATPGTLAADRLQILGRDGSLRAAALKAGGTTIGRAPDSDVVLANPKVSSRHARLEFDGTQYRVTDLNSTNGTYLGSVKLLPGVPEAWPADKPLKIGDYFLRLERSDATAPASTSNTAVDASRIHTSSGGRVGVFVETARYSAEPGRAVTAGFIILNQGAVVDHFKTTVDGVPPEWVTAPPPVQLMPGAQAEMTLTLQPTRSPMTRAGRHIVRVRVSSQDDPAQVAEVRLTLTVGAFAHFTAEVRPQKASAGRPVRVTVNNQGNTPETFRIAPQDPGEELRFQPGQAEVRVEPGQTGVADLRLTTRRVRWFGPPQLHPYSLKIGPVDGEPQILNGQLVSQGLIPAWALALAVVLCLAAGLAGLFAYNQFVAAPATATAVAQATRTQSAAATATAVIGGTQSAIAAATATEAWLAGDEDRDGLTNRRELELNTLPLKLDTDEDGLSDGDEVARGLNPLAADTDGDGLMDSAEVERGLNPLAADTDNDGVIDSQDPDALNAPTLTPDVAATNQMIAAQGTAAALASAAAVPTGTPTATSTPPPATVPVIVPVTPPTVVNVGGTATAIAAQTATAAAAMAAGTQTAAAAATQTEAAKPKVAYVYSSDTATAGDYRTLLEAYGFRVDLVAQSALPSTSLSVYSYILIGPETGDASNWRSVPWGDAGGAQAGAIIGSGKPVVGLGYGGTLYFQAAGLYINWGQSWISSLGDTSVYAVDTADATWNSPYAVTVPPSRLVPLYSSNSSYVAVYMPSPVSGVVAVGRQSDDTTHYPIIKQNDTNLLWGFNASPATMTTAGQNAFVNALRSTRVISLDLIPLQPLITPPFLISP